MARAQGARAQMALAFESTYGTAPASGSYWKLPFASATLGSEQPLLASELLGYGRDPITPVKDAITTDGDVVIPIDARFLGIWLKALFGAPTTTGADPDFAHTFVSGEWTLPSMAIEVGMPDVPSFAMITGCKANQISWQMQRSGLVTATMGMIAQGEARATTAATGTLTELALQRFGSFSGAVSRDDSQLGNITSAQITYSNNLDRIETIRDDGMIEGADPSLASLAGTIEVRFADTVLLDQAFDGDPCKLDFSYTLPGGETFTLTAHAVYLPRPRIPLQGPGGVQASFAWQAALDPVEGVMCTAVLENDVADYDNPS